jgi:hypothetical protein
MVNYFKNSRPGRGLMPVILATWEAEIRRIEVPGKKVHETLF